MKKLLLVMLHTVLLTFRSFHGTDEENLFNIKDPFLLVIMFCYS